MLQDVWNHRVVGEICSMFNFFGSFADECSWNN